MNKLEQFIADNNLSEVTGKVHSLQNNTTKESVGSYVRVLHNTTTGQAIFLKHFTKYDNFMISVNPSTGKQDDFFINQFDKDGVLIQDFEDSIENFKSKPASLSRGPITI